MSRLFGEMRQIAFVVRDMDAALRYWTETLGVGPFFMLRDLVPENYFYREKPAPAPKMTIALGFSGEFQVEVIAQHDDHPSAYRDFLVAGGQGFQHVSSWLTRAEYDRERARHRERGVIAIHEGAVPPSGVRFAYFATGGRGRRLSLRDRRVQRAARLRDDDEDSRSRARLGRREAGPRDLRALITHRVW